MRLRRTGSAACRHDPTDAFFLLAPLILGLSIAAVLTWIAISENKGARFCAESGVLVVRTMSAECPVHLGETMREFALWFGLLGFPIAGPSVDCCFVPMPETLVLGSPDLQRTAGAEGGREFLTRPFPGLHASGAMRGRAHTSYPIRKRRG